MRRRRQRSHTGIGSSRQHRRNRFLWADWALRLSGRELLRTTRHCFATCVRMAPIFGQIKPDNGLELLLAGVSKRAKTHPAAYGHWYVDGGKEADHSPALTCVSYQALESVRNALLKNMQTEIKRPGMGPRGAADPLHRVTKKAYNPRRCSAQCPVSGVGAAT